MDKPWQVEDEWQGLRGDPGLVAAGFPPSTRTRGNAREKHKTSPRWRGLTPLIARPSLIVPVTGLALPPCRRRQVGGHVLASRSSELVLTTRPDSA